MAIASADGNAKRLQEDRRRTPLDSSLARRYALAEGTLRLAVRQAIKDGNVTWDDIALALDVSVTEAMQRYGSPGL